MPCIYYTVSSYTENFQVLSPDSVIYFSDIDRKYLFWGSWASSLVVESNGG